MNIIADQTTLISNLKFISATSHCRTRSWDRWGLGQPSHCWLPFRITCDDRDENVPTLIAPWGASLKTGHSSSISFVTSGVSDVHFH
jgi:hypothetical protein